MRKIISIILLLTILLSACSSNNDSTEQHEQRFSFRIEAGSVDLSTTAYVINDDYNDAIPACTSVTVKTGDKITVIGGVNLGYLRGLITDSEGKTIQDVMMHKSGTLLQQLIEYSSCYSTGTTGLVNAPIWKNDLSNELSITVN